MACNMSGEASCIHNALISRIIAVWNAVERSIAVDGATLCVGGIAVDGDKSREQKE